MRKITEETCNALFMGRNMSLSNTQVADGVMYLHGNAIAKFEEGKLFINNCGYTTTTTKERLNGVLEFNNKDQRIQQIDWVWYIITDEGKEEMPNTVWVEV